MILNFEDFESAAKIVNNVIFNIDETEIENEILNSISDKKDDIIKRNYLRHLNALFLNVILNRVNELGKTVENKAFIARRVIYNLLKEQQVA